MVELSFYPQPGDIYSWSMLIEDLTGLFLILCFLYVWGMINYVDETDKI